MPVGFPESEFPFGACCLHSFLTLSFLFWLHLDYLMSLSLSLQFSWLDYVYTMSALISSSPGGSGVQHRCGCLQIWPEHAVSVSSFWYWGFGQQKGFSIFSFKVSVWNWVMSWAKGMGSRQTSKEFLEFDLNRISLVLVFGLVTCHDGFFLYLLLVSP